MFTKIYAVQQYNNDRIAFSLNPPRDGRVSQTIIVPHLITPGTSLLYGVCVETQKLLDVCVYYGQSFRSHPLIEYRVDTVYNDIA